LNLILNAIDASPDGSGEVSVRTRLDRSPFGDFVAIRVEDDGVGIDPEIRSKIFEPGFTTRGGEHRGLGLAFVARVVADHGGEVVVDERKKTGSAIEIRIPTRSQSVEARPDRVDREAS
jgi:signal transduction histidine kinase